MSVLTCESSSKILISSSLESKDEVEDKLIKCFSHVTGLTNGLSERDVNDVLNAQVAKGQAQHDDVQLGLLQSILVTSDTQQSLRIFRDLTFCCRDGMASVAGKITQLIFEKWLRLTNTARHQVVWVVKEIVKSNSNQAEGLCHVLLRQIAGGDVMARNLWTVEHVLDVLSENRAWLDKYPMLIAMAVYTYLRVIADHFDPKLAALRQKEVNFTMSLMQTKWNDCMTIGRDLIRLLQAVARIPDFEQLWKQIVHNPSSLSPNFTGIMQLMNIRTQKKFLVSRLTPDMENKLVFLTTKVKFGSHKRYQDWFQRQYLSTPESQSLRYDLIRFICACFHPTNELLQSDIIPRWAVIGWLLQTCTSNVAASNAKLALFYDWLFFDPDKDNIMNIEPGILVMFNSMKGHLQITATLLDFLCRIMVNFYPPLATQIKQGVYASLKCIVEKKVLASLGPLFDSARLDRELRATIRDSFAELYKMLEGGQEDGGTKEPAQLNSPDASSRLFMDDRENGFGSSAGQSQSLFKPIDPPVLQAFVPHPSMPNAPGSGLTPPRSTSPPSPVTRPMPTPAVALPLSTAVLAVKLVVHTEHFEKLSNDIKACISDLQQESDKENQCEIMDKLIQAVLEQEEADPDAVTALAATLCLFLEPQMLHPILPEEVTEESLEDFLCSPLCVIFRNLSQLPEDNYNRDPLLQLLWEIYRFQPSIGYRLLYFLKVGKVRDDKMQTYKDMHLSSDNSRNFREAILQDMKMCQEADMQLFTYLLADIFTQFPAETMGNIELINLIVSTIDAGQLQDIKWQIMQGHMTMFKKENVLSLLTDTLEWETIEQIFMWKLVWAHGIAAEQVLPLLLKLGCKQHPEAACSLAEKLQYESPSQDIIRLLLCREPRKGDLFTVSLLKNWADKHEEKLAEILHGFLTKSSATPRKRPRQTSKKEQPTVDNILAHLEFWRSNLRNISFLANETIQEALRQVQSSCSEVQKSQYSELLALIEDDVEEMPSKRNLRLTAARRANNASPKGGGNIGAGIASSKKKFSDSSDDSSEDEDVKPQPKKRKAGATSGGPSVILIDDSD